MSNPYGYTVTLALEDYLPVLLAGAGGWWLASAAGRVVPSVLTPARIGVALTVLGGLSKATWKLLVATDVADVTWLEQLLFPCLAAGFSLLAWALVSAVKRRVGLWWPYAVVLAVAVVASVALQQMRPLFVVTVLSSLAVSAYAVILARRQHDGLAVVMFALQVIGVFGLVPLQNIEEQTLALQWAEQSINTFAQGAFALGAWRVLQGMAGLAPAEQDRRAVEANS